MWFLNIFVAENWGGRSWKRKGCRLSFFNRSKHIILVIRRLVCFSELFPFQPYILMNEKICLADLNHWPCGCHANAGLYFIDAANIVWYVRCYCWNFFVLTVFLCMKFSRIGRMWILLLNNWTNYQLSNMELTLCV